MALIAVEGLGKDFAAEGQTPVTALSEVGFEVARGAFVSLVGPSGCGKSTLLQILAGLTDATRGTVRIDGQTVTEPRPQSIGMVFQEALLLPWKSARDNIAFPLDLQGVPKAEQDDRTDALLRLTELQDFAESYPHQLSVGMRQRVAIARGLSHDPEILLMDEPFAALDEQSRMRMGEELLRIWEATGKTVFLVTHSLTEAVFLSDQVLVMSPRPGRILAALDVPLPRPRRFAMTGDPAFGALRQQIWELIGA